MKYLFSLFLPLVYTYVTAQKSPKNEPLTEWQIGIRYGHVLQPQPVPDLYKANAYAMAGVGLNMGKGWVVSTFRQIDLSPVAAIPSCRMRWYMFGYAHDFGLPYGVRLTPQVQLGLNVMVFDDAQINTYLQKETEYATLAGINLEKRIGKHVGIHTSMIWQRTYSSIYDDWYGIEFGLHVYISNPKQLRKWLE